MREEESKASGVELEYKKVVEQLEALKQENLSLLATSAAQADDADKESELSNEKAELENQVQYKTTLVIYLYYLMLLDLSGLLNNKLQIS